MGGEGGELPAAGGQSPVQQDQVGLAAGPEFDLIRRFLPVVPPPRRDDVRVGPGDDCAVVVGDGIALSVDLSVEGVHFLREWISPFQIGFRAASAALSDLAGMAARPIGVLAAVAVAEPDADSLAVGVMEGVRSAAEQVGAVVLGGDLTRSPGPLVVDVTVVGETSNPVLRSGARPGDEVWVTGELGGAAVAVARLLRGEVPPESALGRFAAPRPRVAEARWLASRGLATAMLDVSDGLVGDAAHIAAASGVAVVLEAGAIPVHPAVLAETDDGDQAVGLAASGGEDYEICFCVRPGAGGEWWREMEAELGTRCTRVGVVEEGNGVFWREPAGSRTPAQRGGFQHFRGRT